MAIYEVAQDTEIQSNKEGRPPCQATDPIPDRMHPKEDTTMMRNTCTPVEPNARIIITTFGALHGPAPHEDRPVVTVGLTTALRNPADDPGMIYMTGLDAKVRDHVLTTPGAEEIINGLVQQVLTTGRDAYVYCRGGRHRSVAVAEESAHQLRTQGLTVTVKHRDIDKPVLRKG